MLDKMIEDFLAHYGVQGMKWGKRKAYNKANVARLQKKGLTKRQAKSTNRYQNLVDKQRMAASGRQGKVSVLKQLDNRLTSNSMLGLGTILKHPLSTQKAALLQSKKNQVAQKKILAGEKKVTAALYSLQGISIKDIDFKV